jgi:hypothetical protein
MAELPIAGGDPLWSDERERLREGEGSVRRHPAALALLGGREFAFESLLGKRLLEALPELKGPEVS